MKKILLMILSVVFSGCTYLEMEDPSDYRTYYESSSAVDKLEYKENIDQSTKPVSAPFVNDHEVPVPKVNKEPVKRVPLNSPEIQ